MPHDDGHYKNQLKQVNWRKVAFGHFNGRECKQQFQKLILIVCNKLILDHLYEGTLDIIFVDLFCVYNHNTDDYYHNINDYLKNNFSGFHTTLSS